MGRFVCKNVVGETGEYGLAVAFEIATEEATVALRVKRICVGEGMRGDMQLVTIETPRQPSTQRELEASQGAHNDCVHVVGVEVEICDQLVDIRFAFEGKPVLTNG